MKCGLLLCLGAVLGAGAAIVPFFQPELQAWAQESSVARQQPDKKKKGGKGSVLPIPEPAVKTITELDARNAKAPPRFEVKPPKGAPNIVIVLIDDMGFGQSSAFGGPVHMPNAEKLAKKGLKYNRFHTCPLSSPTPMAPFTGRTHHCCNHSVIPHITPPSPR